LPSQCLAAILLYCRAIIGVDETDEFSPRSRTLGSRQVEKLTGLFRPGDAVCQEIVFPISKAREAGSGR
jgi:hypothetical protein